MGASAHQPLRNESFRARKLFALCGWPREALYEGIKGSKGSKKGKKSKKDKKDFFAFFALLVLFASSFPTAPNHLQSYLQVEIIRSVTQLAGPPS
jgi:hypothetical protein